MFKFYQILSTKLVTLLYLVVFEVLEQDLDDDLGSLPVVVVDRVGDLVLVVVVAVVPQISKSRHEFSLVLESEIDQIKRTRTCGTAVTAKRHV